MIPVDLLMTFDAKIKHFAKGDYLFREGDAAKHYFQMISGEVKTNNYNSDGKEFIQGIFSAGDSFGEPPLFIDQPYSSHGIAIIDSEVILLPKLKFLNLLRTHPETALAICTRLSDRLYYKLVMSTEISSQDPEHRILKLIDYLKYNVENLPSETKYIVQLTRQQLADLTGLRVETVIRAIKSLEQKKEIIISNRKVLR